MGRSRPLEVRPFQTTVPALVVFKVPELLVSAYGPFQTNSSSKCH